MLVLLGLNKHYSISGYSYADVLILSTHFEQRFMIKGLIVVESVEVRDPITWVLTYLYYLYNVAKHEKELR